MQIPPIPSELFYKFNEVKYYDEPHKYYYNGEQLTSVTTLIHQYENEFDEDYWAEEKAYEYNVTPQEVKRGWKFINNRATMKGSIIHDYAENLFLNKVFPYPKQKLIDHFGYDPVLDQYLKTKEHIDKFYEYSFNKLIPIKTELVVFDVQYKIGGMVDLLVWNVKAQEFQIWDYKTNASDNAFEDSQYFLNGIFDDLTDTDLNKYSLQLSTYKYIIQKYVPIKLGKCYLVWVSHKNENFKVIECKDYSSRVEDMFMDFNARKLLFQ